jgi:hypothetical protein
LNGKGLIAVRSDFFLDPPKSNSSQHKPKNPKRAAGDQWEGLREKGKKGDGKAGDGEPTAGGR